MSGFNKDEAVNRFTGRGLAGFIQKPFKIATMRDKLRSAIQEGQSGMALGKSAKLSVTVQVDSRPSRAPITFGPVPKVVRTVPCAAPSQETPLPHSGLCGPLSPTSPAFLRPVPKVVRTVHCAALSQETPFRTGDCADHFRRQPHPAPLARLRRQSPDQREAPPHRVASASLRKVKNPGRPRAGRPGHRVPSRRHAGWPGGSWSGAEVVSDFG
ncbi:MAG: hypothetical protein RL077_6501 [Verrucomicrobiota bacterium]|jgi:hypothetical protein